MVEKSKKKSPCDTKFGKYGRFLGDRLPETDHHPSPIKHLRAAQAPHKMGSGSASEGRWAVGSGDFREFSPSTGSRASSHSMFRLTSNTCTGE
jgi:hypothetical protein